METENFTLLVDEFKAVHSKYYIIDDEILFLGGINIEDKEKGRDRIGRYQDITYRRLIAFLEGFLV